MTSRTIMAALVSAVLTGGAAVGGLVLFGDRPAAAAQTVEVWKARSCECCVGWVKHMRTAGFAVTVHEVESVETVKRDNGVPEVLASCHISLVGGYTIEGHVPAGDVERLLAERPQAKGLAAPGMPQDAPGMDGKSGQPYQVVLFGAPNGKVQVFANH